MPRLLYALASFGLTVSALSQALMGIGVIAILLGILAAGFSESCRKKRIENEKTVQQQNLVDSTG